MSTTAENPLDVDKFNAHVQLMRDAAKQLMTLTSLLPTVYVALISFSDLHKVVQGLEVLPFLLPTLPWLGSLALITHIFLPQRIIKAEDRRTLLETYRSRLERAYWGLIIGLIWLIVQVGYYLMFVPPPPK